MTTYPTPTARQQRELHAAVRHLGRAMAAFHRANLTQLGDNAPSWLLALWEADDLTRNASDRLVDGLEATDSMETGP